MQRNVIKRLESIRNLPTLPSVIENLGRALKDPEVDVEAIAAVIEDDPAIMARIMKVVNSSMYLGVRETVSLRTAIVRLGFRAVSNIAMSAAVFSTFPPGPGRGFDRAGFWRHCVSAAVAAEVVYREPAFSAEMPIAADILHLGGLLHDIGKIIFEQHFHAAFMEAIEISRDNRVPLPEAEFRVMGMDHAQGGAWLARKWNLSEEMISVIRWHHAPENAPESHRELVRICHLADRLVNADFADEGETGPEGDARALREMFDLDSDDLLYLKSLIEGRASCSPLLLTCAA